jgi:tRNA A-37 threonylcarbamoyl transferase component Bud32
MIKASKMTSNLKLIQQGAEAKIFLDEKNNLIIKDRISKSYRIPELDKKIIKQRTKAEKKLLEKASKIINAPDPQPLKEINIIKMPFIDGEKLSNSLNDFSLEKQKEIMEKIGESVAIIHKEDMIHGDLTTSNMILVEGKENSNYLKNNKVGDNNRVNSNNKKLSQDNYNDSGGQEEENDLNLDNFQIFFIDFGLGYISKKVEDKAVDIHLLRQALEAKHFMHWKVLFEEFKKAYSKNYSESKQIFERITAVERRGRYRH